MIFPGIKPQDLNTALDAVKATYDQLVSDGVDPSVVVIALSETVAFCLAHKAATGGGDELAYRLWLSAFETSYRDHLEDAKAGRR